MSNTKWLTDDDFYNDINFVSFGNKKPKYNNNNKSEYKEVVDKHKSIFDDDSDIEDARRSNCIPVRGRNVLTNMRSPSGKLIFMEHVKETKAAIREASVNNYSNEYIEQVLRSSNNDNEKVRKSKVDLTFKPVLDEVQEEANLAKVNSRNQFTKPYYQQHYKRFTKKNTFKKGPNYS